jgi:hypothetical protein
MLVCRRWSRIQTLDHRVEIVYLFLISVNNLIILCLAGRFKFKSRRFRCQKLYYCRYYHRYRHKVTLQVGTGTTTGTYILFYFSNIWYMFVCTHWFRIQTLDHQVEIVYMYLVSVDNLILCLIGKLKFTFRWFRCQQLYYYESQSAYRYVINLLATHHLFLSCLVMAAGGQSAWPIGTNGDNSAINS